MCSSWTLQIFVFVVFQIGFLILDERDPLFVALIYTLVLEADLGANLLAILLLAPVPFRILLFLTLKQLK